MAENSRGSSKGEGSLTGRWPLCIQLNGYRNAHPEGRFESTLQGLSPGVILRRRK